MTREKNKFEVISDRRTVWANDAHGTCLARFGPFGVDIHVDHAAQMRGEPQCLDCTHHKPDISAWRTFQTLVRRYHGIGIGDDHMPTYIREELYKKT